MQASRIWIGIVMAAVAGVAHADQPPAPDMGISRNTPQGAAAPATLDALLNPNQPAQGSITALRLQMISDAGRTVGFRGGMAARAAQIRKALEAKTEKLSTIYNFAPLVASNGALPPVIVEAQDVASFSAQQYRVASKVYKIERPERFVSNPPTWRDYLYTGLPSGTTVDMPLAEAQPKTGDERDAWQAAVKAGWAAGERNCDAILRANFARMTRDYTGMVTYSTLLQQGMISETRVSESQRTVSGNGNELTLGDTTRRLTGPAQLQANPDQWRPAVSYKPGLVAQPSGTFNLPSQQAPAAVESPPIASTASTVSEVQTPVPRPPLAPASSAPSLPTRLPASASTPGAAGLQQLPLTASLAAPASGDHTFGALPAPAVTNASTAIPAANTPSKARNTTPTKSTTPPGGLTPPPGQADSGTSASPSSAPDSSPAQAVVAPTVRHWSAHAGETLRDVITRWGAESDPAWTVAWNTPLNYPIAAAFTIDDPDFLGAVAKTFGAWSRAQRQFTLGQQPSQHVLVVEELK